MSDKRFVCDGKLHVTTDYEMFVFASWNRNVSKARINKVKKSIETVGYIPSPIVVNENNEIIDGQARITALKELNKNIPVYYIVVDGAGGEECKYMNASMTNWATRDFIHLYADEGNPTYIRLAEIMEKYRKLSDTIVIAAIAGDCSGNIMNKVKDERLVLNDSGFKRLEKRLSFLMEFSDVYLRCGRKDVLQRALLIAFECPGFSERHMVKKLNEEMNVGKYGNVDEGLDFLTAVYNRNRRDGKLDFKHFRHYEYKAPEVWKEG